MEAAALKQITDNAIAAARENQLRTPGGKPAIILGNNVIDTEHLLAGRTRFRGTYHTNIPSAFAGYIKGRTDGSIYVDPDNLRATAVLNEGTESNPGHCDWQAQLKLKHTAGYAAILAINGKQLSQRDISAWLEDWAPMLSAVYNGETQPLSKAIAAVRSISFKSKDESTHTVSDFGARQSGLSEIEASSDVGTLPSRIEAHVVPAQGLSSYRIPLRLSVITGDKPGLVLRVIGLEAIQEAIAIEFRSLVEGLGGNLPVHIGTFSP